MHRHGAEYLRATQEKQAREAYGCQRANHGGMQDEDMRDQRCVQRFCGHYQTIAILKNSTS